MYRKGDNAWYALFVLPLTLVFVTVVVIPFFIGIGYSFVKWDGMKLNPMTYVGFDNYSRIFADSRFWTSALHTTIFTLASVLIINLLGLAYALIVTSRLRVRNAVRAVLFMPYMIGGLILGYIWQFIFSDMFKNLGQLTGWTRVFFNWLLDPDYALVAMIVVTTWQLAGYIMIIYINGIQSIPDDVVEAAKVDGANFWQTLFRVRLPLLMPAFTVCLFVTLSNCFKMFDVNVSLTGGGPNNATELMAMNIYSEIFLLSNYGYGQAKAIIFFIVIASITLIQVYQTKKREVEL